MISLPSAHAQEAEVVPQALAGVETSDDTVIVVTGSRIVSPNIESASPVRSISAEEIARSGETNLIDLLAETPALVNSLNSVRTAGPRARPGGVGINLLNLRNLGDERTLVLVNGRRHVASLPGSAAVDINTIPLSLLERVDVLTGGVSAIYGADGVSGVVNFVLKRDFEGIEANAQSGISSRGDAGEDYISLTAGKNYGGGAGNITLSYEYRRTDRVRAEERSLGRPGGRASFLHQNLADFPIDDPGVPDRVLYDDVRIAQLSPLGGIDLNFDGFPDFTGTGEPYNIGVFLPNSQGLAQGGDGTALAGSSGDFQPAVETHNVNLLLSHEVSPALRLFAEGKFVSTEAYTEGQPNFEGGSLLLADNAYIPASVRAVLPPFPPGQIIPIGLAFRSHFDFGRTSQRSKRETWRGVIGADGDISDTISYEVAYTYGQTKNRFVGGNARIADRYFAALDAVDDGAGNIVCRSNISPQAPGLFPNYPVPPVTYTPGPQSGCSPINILGSNVASDAALGFFQTDLINTGKLTQHVANASITGDFGKQFSLPGGPISFALGGEYRKESSSQTPDDLLQAGLILDAAPISASQGSFDVWEAFAEVQVPVLRDMPAAHLLQFGAALRLSDYSTIGSTTTWKVDGTYAPVRDLRMRGSYSSSVRAPNIDELFGPQTGTRAFVMDPCDIAFVGNGSEFRASNCNALLSGFGIDPASFNPSSNPAAGNIGGITAGTPGLKEETAKTWTAGFVATPSNVPGLVANFDWYDIKLRNAINLPSAQEVVDLCVDQPGLDNVFCPNVLRNPANGLIGGFMIAPANVSRFRAAGADFSVSYAFEPKGDLGRFNVALAGGYLDRLSFVASPGAAATEKAGDAYAPEWTGNFDLTWMRGKVTANYGISYFSKTRRFSANELAANPDISEARYHYYPEKWQHDLQVSVETFDGMATIYGGMQNIFDRKPAIDQAIYPISFRGRFLFIGVRANFGSL
ncbi:MAG: TonB-dependent receptor [Sphingomonadaceae bacterium]|nr:TonB-dependent receptor [Sphingomonadaceae bacterium]